MKTRVWIALGLVVMVFAAVRAAAAVPVGTSFTYQGQLKLSGVPVNDTCDFEFSLWDADPVGSQVSSTQTVNAMVVTGGLFVADIDFGGGAFNGDARWLEVAVRCPTGSGAFTTLAPRTPLAPAPYSIMAMSVAGGSIAPAMIDATNAPSDGMNLVYDGGDFRWAAASADPWQPSGSDIYFTGGRVGIGTSTPATVLDVGGRVLIQPNQGGSIELGGNGMTPNPVSGGVPYLDMHYGNGGAEDFNVRFINAGDNWLNIVTADYGAVLTLRDGNVGIGRIAPETTLHVQELTGTAQVRVQSNNGQAGISFISDNTVENVLYSPAGSDDLRFEINGSDRVSLTSAGNVGIGTTNPTAKLQIGGTPGVDGIRFPDNSMQYTAMLEGPPGPAGPAGPAGPQGPAGPSGPAIHTHAVCGPRGPGLGCQVVCGGPSYVQAGTYAPCSATSDTGSCSLSDSSEYYVCCVCKPH